MQQTKDRLGVKRALKIQLGILIGFLGLFWCLELVDTFLLHQTLNGYGIRPHHREGLLGILFAPFLHGSLIHLSANTVPFIVLGWLVMVPRPVQIFPVSLITILVGGLGVWLVGDERSIHLGASGLIFGYLGFLLGRGFFERSLRSLLIAGLVGILYGGLLWGGLPGKPGVSWESHLFGFLGGLLAAWILTRPHRQTH